MLDEEFGQLEIRIMPETICGKNERKKTITKN